MLWDTGGASAGFQNPQTEQNPDLTHPVEFRAASIACHAKTWGIGREMIY